MRQLLESWREHVWGGFGNDQCKTISFYSSVLIVKSSLFFIEMRSMGGAADRMVVGGLRSMMRQLLESWREHVWEGLEMTNARLFLLCHLYESVL